MINHRYNIYKKEKEKKKQPRSQGDKPKKSQVACVYHIYIIEFLLIQAAYVERMPHPDAARDGVRGDGVLSQVRCS